MKILLLLSVLSLFPKAQACITFANDPKEKIFIGDERAIIFWDEKSKTEHFIRRADFKGSSNFSFIVPTPTKPQLAEISDDILKRVWSALYNRQQKSLGVRGGFGGGSDSIPANGVKVLETVEVANMDAAILDASDAGSLEKWLKDNKYASQGAKDWAQPYIQKKWLFTAFKIKSKKNASKTEGISSPMVRISFKTDKPFFPYREAGDRTTVPGRKLDLFVIAPTTMQGNYEKTPWQAEMNYSTNALDVYNEILRDTKDHIPGATNTKGYWVSHFKDYVDRRPLAEDVYFTAAKTKK